MIEFQRGDEFAREHTCSTPCTFTFRSNEFKIESAVAFAVNEHYDNRVLAIRALEPEHAYRLTV
jgi:hypothetical protein